MADDQPTPEDIASWVAGREGPRLWLNATGVAIDGLGIVILGASGSGKSTLALELLAHGAALIADDGLWISTDTDPPTVARATGVPDMIEARGIGLLHAGVTVTDVPLALLVDLDHSESRRLPPRRLVAVGNALCPLIRGAGLSTLAPAILLLARHGRADV